MKVTLVATPAPAQYVNGSDRPLGTVRTYMHKAPITALAAWLRDSADVGILDMQSTRDVTSYGTLLLGDVELEKCRVGMSFEEADELLADSDVVGLNANFTHSRRIAGDLLGHLRRSQPERTLLVGGTDATAEPDFYLRSGADVVVRGEGELVARDVIRCLESHAPLTDVPNISVRRNGDVDHHPRRFLRDPLDVDTLPPHALDLVDLRSYSDTGEGRPPRGIEPPFISVETSRGCAQACSFCATPRTKGRFRFMSPDVMEEHLRHYKEAGVRTLLFQEDNLLSRVHEDRRLGSSAGRDNLLELFRIARELGFAWEFTNGLEFGQLEHEGRIDTEIIEAMFWRGGHETRREGCYRATIPLENVLDLGPQLFRKLKDSSKSWPVIDAVAATGVDALSFNVIVGRPEDDVESLRTTYRRCEALRELVRERSPATDVYFNVYLLSLLPGTLDHRRFNHQLAYDLDEDPEVVTFYLGSMTTPNFTPEAITRARGSLASALNDDTLISDFDETHYLTSPELDRWLS
jgi:hypothetical protein